MIEDAPMLLSKDAHADEQFAARSRRRLRVAFCVLGVSANDLLRSEFYRADLDILSSLGFDVDVVTEPWRLRPDHDVAFVWWWNALWLWGPAARRLGIPIVATGTFDIVEFERRAWFKKLLKIWGVQFADRHVFVSELETRVVPDLVEIPRDIVSYSPHVVDAATYVNDGAFIRQHDPFTILNVCWQHAPNMRRKMVPELLDAFAAFHREVPSSRLVLAGPPLDGGPLLWARAAELGLRDAVEFPGEITRERKVALMQRCSLYAQVSRFEGFGVAIAEAMSCGAPVLTSRVGAVPEVVGDCAAFVDDLSVEGILAGLRHCHADWDENIARGRRGADRVRSLFSMERRREDLRRAIEAVSKVRT